MNIAATGDANQRMSFESERSAPPEGFPSLPDIPGSRYVDPEFLALENTRMWQRAWLYAGHKDQIAKPGSWFVTRNTGSAIIVLHDLEGEIRAFYNTCQHRGAPLVTEDSGEGRGFVCGYHGWSYSLDGRLRAVRDKRDFVDLDFSCRSLVPVRCERLGNLIFVNEDMEAMPLIDHIGPMADELDQYGLDKLRLVDKRSYDVECNAKILIDAFLEVYHIKSIHKDTVDRFLDHRGMFITLWPNGHSRMVTPNSRPDWTDPGAIGMPRIGTLSEIARTSNVSYNIYPNFVMPPSDSGIPLLQFWPTSDTTCRVDSTWIAPEHDAENPDPKWETRLKNWKRILDEDLQFAPQIQQSLQSKGFRGMPLNYQERRIYHWHEELDRCIGLNQVPPDARVSQVLEDWVDG